MKVITIRDIQIGEGIAKICIPLIAKTKEELLKEAMQANAYAFDILEWRIDHFQEVMQLASVLETAHALRSILHNKVLLVTFRSIHEGGVCDITANDYVKLYSALIKSGAIDMIDIEAYTMHDQVIQLLTLAKAHHVVTLMSNHDFHQTPTHHEMIERLRYMQQTGGDIVKIAFMPQSRMDVLNLLQAVLYFYEQEATCPIVAMSMEKMGALSRICADFYGSAISFGALQHASAPGQIAVQELEVLLHTLHPHVKK